MDAANHLDDHDLENLPREALLELVKSFRTLKERQAFLVKVNQLLAASLDYETTLKNIAALAVPHIADWISIDLFDERQQLRQLVVSHSDPVKQQLGEKLRENYLLIREQPNPALTVAQTGQSLLLTEFTEDIIRADSPTEQIAELLIDLQLKAMLLVPLMIRERVLGVLSFISADSGRVLGQEELLLAEELARQAALAIENAQLYRTSQENRERFEVTLSSIGDGVITTDTQGRVTFMNRVAERLTGWTLTEATGVALPLIFNVLPDSIDDLLNRVIGEKIGVQARHDTTLVTRQQQHIPINDTISPICDSSGNVIGVVIVLRDVSEQKQAEQARRKHLESIARLEERQRIAYDLHDAVSQTLFSSSIIAEALPNFISKPEKLPARLDQLKRLNRGALAEMRTILQELQGEEMSGMDIQKSLEQLVDIAMGKTQINITLTTDIQQLPAPDILTTFYRIAQEAVTNIVKHARATEAHIYFDATPRGVTLSLKDNGRGFDLEKLSRDSVGLSFLQKRAQGIGAAAEITSAVGAGTEIRVALPLRVPFQ